MPRPISLLRAFALAWLVAIIPLAVVLLVSAVTGRGVVFALGALLLGIAPTLAWTDPEAHRLRRAAVSAVVAWLAIAGWLYFSAPNGRPPSGARVENRYVGGQWQYQRAALGAMLPEVDQFMMGFRLMPCLDPLLTFEQARPLAEDTRTIYAELEADPDFHALGSVMPGAYDELWSFPFDHGHYFLYVPRTIDRRAPAPALVFLHGSGGNFKSYVWLLSKVADERGMVLIAPSYGFGNWDTKGGPPAVIGALEDAAEQVSIDAKRVHLAGLSNGGLGVCRTVAFANGDRFRSVIFLSPVFDTQALESPALSERWRGKPVLVITGDSDDRVPAGYVNDCVKVIREVGANAELSIYKHANHFLFFSHRDRCLEELLSWLKQHGD